MSNYSNYIMAIRDARNALIFVANFMKEKDNFGIQKTFIREIKKVIKGKIGLYELNKNKDELGVRSDKAQKIHSERYRKKPRAICKRCQCKIGPTEPLFVNRQGGVYCSISCAMYDFNYRRIEASEAEYNRFVKQSIMDSPRG